MALSGKAIFLDGADGTERPDGLMLRRMIRSLVGVNGFAGATAMKVSQRGAGANMSVDIAAGSAYTEHTDSSSGGYLYDYNDATFNIAITAADGTNPRRDLVIIHHPDTGFGGANDVPAFAVVAGTPAGSPVDPDPDAAGYTNWQTIARVAVAAGASSITNANITDLRNQLPYAGVKVQQSTVSGGPTSGTTALTIGTVSIAAQPLAYDIECSLVVDAANTVAADVARVSINVDGNQKATLQNRQDNAAGALNFSIPTSTLVTIAADTACTVTATLARSAGTGTYTVTDTGVLTAKMYFLHQ